MSTAPDEIDLQAEIELELAEEIAAAEGWADEEAQDFEARFSPREDEEDDFVSEYHKDREMTNSEIRRDAHRHRKSVNASRHVVLGTETGSIQVDLTPRHLKIWGNAIYNNTLLRDCELLIDLISNPGSTTTSYQLKNDELVTLVNEIQLRFNDLQIIAKLEAMGVPSIAWRSIKAQGIRRYGHGG